MSFHDSCISFDLDDDHILKAVLRDEDGGEQDSELDLNDIIGNNNGTSSPASCILKLARRKANHLAGSFEWGGCEFKESASDIHLHREGDEGLPILRAKLNNVDGEEVEADINLTERISNDNGNLVFV
jgi:hypothetical protein